MKKYGLLLGLLLVGVGAHASMSSVRRSPEIMQRLMRSVGPRGSQAASVLGGSRGFATSIAPRLSSQNLLGSKAGMIPMRSNIVPTGIGSNNMVSRVSQPQDIMSRYYTPSPFSELDDLKGIPSRYDDEIALLSADLDYYEQQLRAYDPSKNPLYYLPFRYFLYQYQNLSPKLRDLRYKRTIEAVNKRNDARQAEREAKYRERLLHAHKRRLEGSKIKLFKKEEEDLQKLLSEKD